MYFYAKYNGDGKKKATERNEWDDIFCFHRALSWWENSRFHKNVDLPPPINIVVDSFFFSARQLKTRFKNHPLQCWTFFLNRHMCSCIKLENSASFRQFCQQWVTSRLNLIKKLQHHFAKRHQQLNIFVAKQERTALKTKSTKAKLTIFFLLSFRRNWDDKHFLYYPQCLI